MSNYFTTERELLKREMQKFAQKHPGQAIAADPYIDRLLEGVAYLTAKIHQRIDDEIPEISKSLLQQFCHRLLKPFPSTTIMQFQPLNTLQTPLIINKNTTIQTSPRPDANQCKFSTIAPIIINPIELKTVVTHKNHNTIIELILTPKTPLNTLDFSNFNLYINASLELATELHYALTTKTKAIVLEIAHKEIELDPQKTITTRYLHHPAIANIASQDLFAAAFILQEYFLFPEKLFFIGLNLPNDLNWPKTQQQIKFKINLQHQFTAQQPTSNIFLLHCVPAINLFLATSEPIKINHQQTQYPITTDQHTKIYQIKTHQDISDFKYLETKKPYYQFSDHDGDYYVSLKNSNTFSTNTLSFDLTCHNGNYPKQHIREHQLIKTTKDLSKQVTASNITHPTKIFDSPHNNNQQWQLIAQLSANIKSLSELENFKQILQTYEWSNFPQNQQKIAAITSTKITPKHQIHRGALTQLLEHELTITETNFTSDADIHLFGLVLHNFLLNYAPINHTVITKLITNISGTEFTWQNHGNKPLN